MLPGEREYTYPDKRPLATGRMDGKGSSRIARQLSTLDVYPLQEVALLWPDLMLVLYR